MKQLYYHWNKPHNNVKQKLYIVHCERNFKQQVKNTYLEKIDVQKKFDDATDLNKILKPYVGTKK
jgi:hypothetical protein